MQYVDFFRWVLAEGRVSFFTIAHSLSAHYNLMIPGVTYGTHLSAVFGFLLAILTDYKQYDLTNTRSLPNNARDFEIQFVNISYCIRYHELTTNNIVTAFLILG